MSDNMWDEIWQCFLRQNHKQVLPEAQGTQDIDLELSLQLVFISAEVKGIVRQFVFYRSNLIFWIVMGRGIAGFGRRGL